MRPNVLLVVLDAARRDSLEPYGASAGSSPAIAQLANRGRALENVHATAPWTVPSHASIFTGLMPRQAGLSRVASPRDVRSPIDAVRSRLLSTVMSDAGYSTGAASANLWLSKTTGFDAGFEDFAEIDTNRNGQIHLDSPREKLRWYREALQARADDGAGAIEAAVARWASDPGRRPFFSFVNLLECHSPYLPPYPYGGRAPISRLLAARDARRHYTLAGFWRACSGAEAVPDEVLERGRRFYAASIAYMDAWLARVLEGLDAQDALEDTLVIVLSDHGENFGEDGLIGHGLSLDQRLINVPFVAAGPGADSLELYSLLELPAALAGVCGIDHHPWTERLPQGCAVAQFDPPVMAGETENIEKLRNIGIEGAALDRFITPITCAVRGELKLVRRGGEDHLFNLASDPGETRPMSVGEADSDLAEEIAVLDEALTFGSEPLARQEPSTSNGPSDEEVRELEERMKLLGYM